MKNLTKNEGILFWITGLSGAGKSSIGKSILKNINKKFGPTLLLHGDNFRKIFNVNGYSKIERFENGKKFIKFVKLITDQNINVILTVVGLIKKLRKKNRKKFKNYVEIYIKSDIKNIIKLNKKKLYRKEKYNILGLDIKPEFPSNADIMINNNFKKNIKELSQELFHEIDRKYNKLK